jgi:hypothetical protein
MGARRLFKNFESNVVGEKIDAIIGRNGIPSFNK